MNRKLLWAVLVFSASIPALSQVAPEAVGGPPLSVGVGYSNFYTDWSGRLSGPVLWADWNFYQRPAFLNGFGVEIEARDLNYDRTGGDSNLRMDTAAGGVIYSWRHYHRFHPYAKCLVGFGSLDFDVNAPNYSHETRTVYVPGGGAEFRVLPSLWVRGSYEYQTWPDLFHHHALNPQGLNIGVSYDFRRASLR